MPALPPVPNVMKLLISGKYHDAKWLNIWYVQYTGVPPSATDIGNYLGGLKPHVDADYGNQMSVDNEITELEGIDLNSSTGARAVVADSTFGVRSGDFVPANVALVSSMEINRRYRGGHPRKYLPFGTAGTYATGSTVFWDTSFLAAVSLSIDDFLSKTIGVTYGSTTWSDNVNVSYVSGGARRITPVVDVISSHVERDRICTQRRRLGKVGG